MRYWYRGYKNKSYGKKKDDHTIVALICDIPSLFNNIIEKKFGQQIQALISIWQLKKQSPDSGLLVRIADDKVVTPIAIRHITIDKNLLLETNGLRR